MRHINFHDKNNSLGVLLMLVHALSMSGVYILKKCLTPLLEPEYITLIYRMAVLVLIIPIFVISGVKRNILTEKLHLYIPKAFFATMATIFFVRSLATLHASDASAITYLEGAVVSIVGIVYFRERIGIGKIVMILSALIAVMFVMRPWEGEINEGYFYVLGAVLCWTFNNILVKILGQTEKNITQVFYNALLTSIIAFITCCFQDVDFGSIKVLADFKGISFIFALGALHLIHMVAFFTSVRVSELSFVIPFDYTRLVFTTLLGYLVIGERPDIESLYGYAIIICGAAAALYLNRLKDKGIVKQSA